MFSIARCLLSALFISSTAAAQYTPSQAETYIAIRQVLNTYPLAIDSKDFSLLSQVFASDAVANYSAPLNILTPLTTIATTLEASLAPVTTQHALTTQLINITSATTANSTTYYTASHFGKGIYEGQLVYAYGKYLDELECIPAASAGPIGSRWWWRNTAHNMAICDWRISRRQLVYMVSRVNCMLMLLVLADLLRVL